MFNEESLEKLFMNEFEARGYVHIDGETIEGEHGLILVDDFNHFIKRKYGGNNLTDTELNMALAMFPSKDSKPYVNNRNTFRKIVDLGVGIIRKSDGKHLTINLIDFDNPENNTFKIVNQYTIRGNRNRECRPDAILFVNGIPLVVIEFKSTVREDATLLDAYKQIHNRYMNNIPDLFIFNAFTVISDGINTKIGTVFSKYEHYYSWNKVNSTDVSSEGSGTIDTVMDGVFTKERLLSIIKNYIYFPDTTGEEEKIICRYPQYFATELLYENIVKKMKPLGDGRGGTYFGTTGCGKSFTMVFLSRKLMRSQLMKNPTIVLITDRTNLDDQLGEQFVNSKTFIGDDNIQSVESRDDLKLKLAGCLTGSVLVTTIQKFSEANNVLSDRDNIIVMSDEAHRSQLNLQDGDVFVKGVKKHVTGFAKILHDSLPNATYVGFTGTPIDNTLEVFGDIVDQYTMVESENDHITSKLVYEPRVANIILDKDQLKIIEQYYGQCEKEGSNKYQIEKSKKEMAKVDAVIGNTLRLSKIADDFIAHYEKRVDDGISVAGKVMFVCYSRQIAYKFYCLLKERRPEWFEIKADDRKDATDEDKAEPIEMVKIVATRDKDDPKEMFDLLGDNEYKKKLDNQFKKIHSNFKIAIVVDMWLTGFDVSFLDAIYIDKPIQKHNLIQAVSRVNRIHEGKEYGLIVDYLGIEKELDAALKKYTNGYKSDGLETVDLFVDRTKEFLNILDGIFHGFDSSDYFGDDEKKQLECLSRASEFIQKDKDTEERFIKYIGALKTSYNNCAISDRLTKEERDRIYFYSAIKSFISKIIRNNAPDTVIMNRRVNELLERAMQSDEVKQLLVISEELDKTTVDLLSDEYLERIKKIPGINTKFKLLARLAKISIKRIKRTNKEMADEFSDRIQKIVDKYNDRHFREEDLAALIEEITSSVVEIAEAQKEGKRLGLDEMEFSFHYMINKIIDEYDFEFDKSKVPEMAKKLRECADNTCSLLDWKSKADVRETLKMEIILVLDSFDFPPEYREGLYQKIFEQLKNYKSNQS